MLIKSISSKLRKRMMKERAVTQPKSTAPSKTSVAPLSTAAGTGLESVAGPSSAPTSGEAVSEKASGK